MKKFLVYLGQNIFLVILFTVCFFFGWNFSEGLRYYREKQEATVVLPKPITPVDYIVPPDAPDESEVLCIATAVYHEARGESTAGKLAVMHVIANRANHESKTICDIVHAGIKDANGKPIRGKCQFSWYCDGRSDEIKEYGEFSAIRDTARDFLENRPVDITDGAKWFRTLSVKSRPYGDRSVQIDNHVFYK